MCTKTINYRYDQKCFMFCLHSNNCINTDCMELVQNVSNYIIRMHFKVLQLVTLNCFTQNTILTLILKISSSTWNFMQRDYKISVDNCQYFRSKLYYRVYTLKHCEIILLHSYINYDTKYQIWCYGYNFYRIQWPISHYTGQPKCPIGNGSNSN